VRFGFKMEILVMKWVVGFGGGVVGYGMATFLLVGPSSGGVGQDEHRGYILAIAFAVGSLVSGFGYSVLSASARQEDFDRRMDREGVEDGGTISFSCMFCHRGMEFPKRYAGQRFQCPGCSLLTPIPTEVEGEPAAPEAAAERRCGELQ
jgi:hypothetical protein